MPKKYSAEKTVVQLSEAVQRAKVCCLRGGIAGTGDRLSFGSCRDGRDPDLCADCSNYLKKLVEQGKLRKSTALRYGM